MASALMKLVLAHVLMRFDVLPGLGHEGGRGMSLSRSLSFEEFYVGDLLATSTGDRSEEIIA